jgi:hypothetical protein
VNGGGLNNHLIFKDLYFFFGGLLGLELAPSAII